MRTLAEFVKTTLIGGLLIILPIYVSLILIAKALQGLLAAMQPGSISPIAKQAS
jgi:uncharacterized membrane protein